MTAVDNELKQITQLDALKALAVKLDAGDDWRHDPMYKGVPGFSVHLHYLIGKSFDGSLDAAKALHEAVLPGWDVTHAWGNKTDGWTWNLTKKTEKRYVSGHDKDEARARLISTIKAKIAELE